MLSALSATLVISLVPFLLLFLLFQCRSSTTSQSVTSHSPRPSHTPPSHYPHLTPHLHPRCPMCPTSPSSSTLISPSLLRLFVCFAVGGLLGDAFLHLIPHSINPHTHACTSPPHPFIQYLTTTLLPFSNPTPPSSSFSFPHTSPSSSHTHDHSHDHSHGHSHDHSHGGEEVGVDARGQRAGLLVLTGMLLFFLIEKGARLRMGGEGGGEVGGHGHSHGHSHGPALGHTQTTAVQQAQEQSPVVAEDDEVDRVVGPAAAVLKRRRGVNNGTTRSPSKSPPPSSSLHHQAHSNHSPPLPSSSTASSSLSLPTSSSSSSRSLVGVLNLLADVSHNFTDGLAISASFLSSPSVGLSTTLAVLIHEVPHEVGDFAILIQAGYSLQQALYFQLATAVGALLGVLVVWVSGGGGEGAGGGEMEWVLPVTAGGFIYVGLVNVVPGILKEDDSGGTKGPPGARRWLQAAGEVAAMSVGVGLMVLIGLLE